MLNLTSGMSLALCTSEGQKDWGNKSFPIEPLGCEIGSFEGLRTSSTLLKLLNVSTAPFIFTLSAHYGCCSHPGSMLYIGIRHFDEGVMSCEVSGTRAEEPQCHSPTMPWLLHENAFTCVKSFLCSFILLAFTYLTVPPYELLSSVLGS
jgi:hypothetical protein